MQDAKQAARTAARAVRARAQACGAEATRRANDRAVEAVGRLPGLATVAGYLPIRDELDPRPAMETLAALGHRICVPVVAAPGRPLAFHVWTPGAATAPGTYRIAVPVAAEADEPDVLLVPLLAFDRRGHRLGYGGGYYDRTIAALRARRPVVALGFAYAAQEIPLVPDAEFDTHLDGVVTEEGCLVCDGSFPGSSKSR
ncbi:MAG: 5-formyltetrahydrofolate cyclo-ligase [Amaricoccus sp.]